MEPDDTVHKIVTQQGGCKVRSAFNHDTREPARAERCQGFLQIDTLFAFRHQDAAGTGLGKALGA